MGEDDKRAERADDRVTINKEFESFDAFIQEYVTNISRTGAFIKSKTPLPIGRYGRNISARADRIPTVGSRWPVLYPLHIGDLEKFSTG